MEPLLTLSKMYFITMMLIIQVKIIENEPQTKLNESLVI